eukprot:TRINITY_DN5230_c0_g1_i1.p1 TRINITY_DN5230_c0_g1~~TRINITY_DN5230_c0_g1_i1.p1  ORF type:complete len:392 (+),score=151.60 TRINITY_DN5230_c0_g1_i1:125-1300(+)
MISRRKNVLSEDAGDEDIKSSSPLQKLDVFPKVKTTDQKRTSSGIYMTVFLAIVVVLFVWQENQIFWQPITEDFMFVDTEVDEEMKIYLDVSFFKMTCDELIVDVVDNNGDQQIAVDHEIVKISLNEAGAFLESRTQEKLGSAAGTVFLPEDYCGSCYGATTTVCCNTCDDLKNEFIKVGRDTSLAEVSPQCKRERKYGPLPGEKGCRVRGILHVPKIRGNFHVAAGSSHAQTHAGHSHHIHHINLTTIDDYDISHRVNLLHFGDTIPNMINPLDGYEFIAEGPANLGYYIQLVPSAYQYLDGTTQTTNQYSYYRHDTKVNTKSNHFRLPGVFFKFDYFPMRIKYVEQSKPVLPFIIRLCAVIGGMYIAAGWVNAIFASLSSSSKKRSTHF